MRGGEGNSKIIRQPNIFRDNFFLLTPPPLKILLTNHMPKISLLICTLNDRVANVASMLLPQREEVCYVVSFQYTNDLFLQMIPEELRHRSDVTILPLPKSGLSVNRNHALRHCATPLAIIADDDARYTEAQIDHVISTFEQNPDVDIACFQVLTTDGTPMKPYADYTFDYPQRPRGTYISSLEIALRLDQCLPLFDTRFGLGAPYLSCGEEEVFIHQAHQYGLCIRYFPFPICTIPNAETTGSRFFYDKRVRRSKGAVFYMLYSTPMALLRIVYAALTMPLPDAATRAAHHVRPKSSIVLRWACFRDMFDGFIYIMTHPLNDSVAEEIPIDFQETD